MYVYARASVLLKALSNYQDLVVQTLYSQYKLMRIKYTCSHASSSQFRFRFLTEVEEELL